MSLADPGENRSWMKSDAISVTTMFLCLPDRAAVSPMNMNRKALVIEAPAPVAAVYMAQAETVSMYLNRLAFRLFPATDNILEMMP